eukprot:CAMPEP_0168531154 /NCGR_PEP_ID=MMETSP0405-20121227/15219_1 /TAXON_ID=498012 /ORGANISM="Trichosphaerium sp, Strain Am-I-7 wt" /LENGTH=165 /DNA_ID=CAMNT_0008555783 /DNA_START=14 /DNA_END=511 /DNA_ORIENTATION=-
MDGDKPMSKKNTLYVGGLEDTVTEQDVRGLFLPFGDLAQIQMPRDHATNTSRGFAFVVFEDADDAFHARDNIDQAEFYGRVLKVNYANPNAMVKNQAVWDTEEYQDKVIRTEEAGVTLYDLQQKQEKDEQAAIDAIKTTEQEVVDAMDTEDTEVTVASKPPAEAV